MIGQMLKWIYTEHLIEKGDHVIVGLSGGADSVCLLLLLKEAKEQLACTLSAVHIEHGIRGEESLADAAFVRKLCEKQEIPCRIYPVDAPAFAKERGIGLEEAARLLRYDCYQKEIERIRQKSDDKMRGIRVALAHHADDNAETILFQMVRGSGLTGLCGMPSKRELTEGADLIRPLLECTRKEIEAELVRKNQNFCVDITNNDVEYSRNRLRHLVMPQLAEVNPQAVSHISRTGALLTELRQFLLEQVKLAEKSYCKRDGETVLLGRALFDEAPALVIKELIHELLAELSGGGKDIGEVHVEAVYDLAGRQVGRRMELPGKLVAERVYEGIRLGLENPACTVGEGAEALIEIDKRQLSQTLENGKIQIETGDVTFFLKLYPAGELLQTLTAVDFPGKMKEIAKKRYTKWFDYDKIQNGLVFRKRQSGDYLTLDEAGHKKKLKSYFIDEKVPKEEREQIWLLADGAHIVWVTGGRMSAACRVTQDTEQILEVQMTGGNEK